MLGNKNGFVDISDGAPSSLQKTTTYEKMIETDQRIQIRDKIIHEGVDAFKNTSSMSRYNDQFLNQYQRAQDQWVCCNIAYKKHRPWKEKPAVRFLSVFATQQEAKRYMDNGNKKYMPNCTIWAFPCKEWVAMMLSTESQMDTIETVNHVEQLKALYEFDKEKRDREFINNQTNKREGLTEMSIEARKKKLEVKRSQRRSSRLKALQQLKKNNRMGIKIDQETDVVNRLASGVSNMGIEEVPSEMLHRRQRVLVVSWMRDISRAVMTGSEDPQPCFNVLGAFDNDQDAFEYLKIASLAWINFDLEVVDQYEWLFPEDIDRSQMNEIHRNKLQDSVVNQRKKEHLRTQDYRNQCKLKGVEPKVIDVMPNITKQKQSILAPQDFENPIIENSEIKTRSRVFDATIMDSDGKSIDLNSTMSNGNGKIIELSETVDSYKHIKGIVDINEEEEEEQQQQYTTEKKNQGEEKEDEEDDAIRNLGQYARMNAALVPLPESSTHLVSTIIADTIPLGKESQRATYRAPLMEE